MVIEENKLNSKKDYQIAINQLCNPLKNFYSEKGARLIIGSTGTYCTEKTSYMEAFARPLWGLVPLLAGGGSSDLYSVYLQGIKNGTNDKSDEYWGIIDSKDQRMVEMAVIGLALCLIPEYIWKPLNQDEQENLYNWLYQINNNVVVDSNWLFFRVLVNLGLKNVGVFYDICKLDSDLKRLDEFYLDNGWYSDGISEQRDYYIAFAMHFYGLIYSKIMENDDYIRAKLYRKRAAEFAEQFIYWFSKDGSAIPFGRSLTYRFSQASFWSALAFADVEVFSWGVIKGILSRNLRWWFKKPIFTTDNILTIGYAYPNLNIAEGYNAPGSPYWALKAFLPVCLDDNHPFWIAKEEQMPELSPKSVQIHPHMIIQHENDSKHVVALTSGQFADFRPVHFAAKYEKFAYSNIFGFSVPRSDSTLEHGAYDSMLALSEGDEIYRVRQNCVDYKINDNYIYSLWKPWNDVEIKTWIIPYGKWHIRIHEINSKRDLETAEGGFAIFRNDDEKDIKSSVKIENNKIIIDYPWGLSGIVDLSGNRQPVAIFAEPNTNLINPRTLIPTLKCKINKGENKFITAVFGNENNKIINKLWSEIPDFDEIIKGVLI